MHTALHVTVRNGGVAVLEGFQILTNATALRNDLSAIESLTLHICALPGRSLTPGAMDGVGVTVGGLFSCERGAIARRPVATQHTKTYRAPGFVCASP